MMRVPAVFGGLFVSVVCLGVFVPFPALASDDSAWKLTAQGKGISLYQKPSDGASDLVAFRVIGVLNASSVEVATAILDRKHRPEWMRDIRELKTLRVPSPGTVVEYSAVKTPWIIKDRDFVIRTEVEIDVAKRRFVIVSKSVTDPDAPETSAVRGALVEGRFIVEPGTDPGTSRLTADMDVDPKGSVPRWIVNHFQKNWPLGMFYALTQFLGRKVATLPEELVPLFAPFGPTEAASQK